MADAKGVARHIPALYDFAETEQFGNFIMLMIVVNTVVMMTRHYPETDEFEFANVIMEYIFNAVFFVEFIIKHPGTAWRGTGPWVEPPGRDHRPELRRGHHLAPDGRRRGPGVHARAEVLRACAVRVLKAAPELAVMNSMWCR